MTSAEDNVVLRESQHADGGAHWCRFRVALEWQAVGSADSKGEDIMLGMRAKLFRLAEATLLIVAVGCSVSAQYNDARAEAVVVSETDSSDELRVAIDQPDAPVLMRSMETVDLRFRVMIKNPLMSPVIVHRITLQSAGSSTMDIPVSMRKYDRVVPSQAEEIFNFWATARPSTPSIGTVRVPIALRAKIVFTTDGEKKEAVFVRQVNGRVSGGVFQ